MPATISPTPWRMDTNPYWDRDLNRQLSCRQNFHINMSDGFWNGGNPAPTPVPALPWKPGAALSGYRTHTSGSPFDPVLARFFNGFSGTRIEPDAGG